MQPTNLKAIARDAALRGDTKTLIHTLGLLERLIPIATFMDFCTELEELRMQGRTHGRIEIRFRGGQAARYACHSWRSK